MASWGGEVRSTRRYVSFARPVVIDMTGVQPAEIRRAYLSRAKTGPRGRAAATRGARPATGEQVGAAIGPGVSTSRPRQSKVGNESRGHGGIALLV